MVTNLRQDPWERYQTEGMLYGRWWGEKLWTLVPAMTIAGEFLATFTEYPPSQASGTLSVEKALAIIQRNPQELTRHHSSTALDLRAR